MHITIIPIFKNLRIILSIDYRPNIDSSEIFIYLKYQIYVYIYNTWHMYLNNVNTFIYFYY